MFTGGRDADSGHTDTLADSWILNLDTFTWTSVEPMAAQRAGHGCVLTNLGEVLVAGGQAGNGEINSVEIYNPKTNVWRQESEGLPTVTASVDPVLFLWNSEIIMIEEFSEFLWKKTESGWETMKTSMGQLFHGDSATAVLVPEDYIQCP